MSTSLYTRLQRLLPQPSLLVGQVVAHREGGMSEIRLPGNQTTRARGQSVAVGAQAFVRDGQVLGPAPDLPVVTVEV